MIIKKKKKSLKEIRIIIISRQIKIRMDTLIFSLFYLYIYIHIVFAIHEFNIYIVIRCYFNARKCNITRCLDMVQGRSNNNGFRRYVQILYVYIYILHVETLTKDAPNESIYTSGGT